MYHLIFVDPKDARGLRPYRCSDNNICGRFEVDPLSTVIRTERNGNHVAESLRGFLSLDERLDGVCPRCLIAVTYALANGLPLGKRHRSKTINRLKKFLDSDTKPL